MFYRRIVSVSSALVAITAFGATGARAANLILIRYMLQPTLFPAGKPAPGGAKGAKFATCGGCVPRLGPVPGCSPEVAEVHD